ncbi:MAG: hypothetical protein SGJ00_04710 [bacterium]|nr:hypothetical protein [bacterium]
MQGDYHTLIKNYQQEFNNRKITLSSNYTHKINARNFLRTGAIMNRLYFDLNQGQLIDSTNYWNTFIQNSGSAYSVQSYFQLKHTLNEALSINLGVHYLGLLLNNTGSFEPRAAIKYEANKKNVITFGYGLHS